MKNPPVLITTFYHWEVNKIRDVFFGILYETRAPRLISSHLLGELYKFIWEEKITFPIIRRDWEKPELHRSDFHQRYLFL